MLVKEGEIVHRGQLLATLDAARLQHNADLLEAQLAAQQQVVARLKAGSRPEEIRKARADAEAARIDAVNAERTYRRINELVAQKFVSRQQADDAKAALDAAQAKYESLQATLRLAELGPRAEDVAAAIATLKANEAALAVARKQLADASLYAPADGIIQDRIVEPGAMALAPACGVYARPDRSDLGARVRAGAGHGQNSSGHGRRGDHGQLSRQALSGVAWLHFAQRRIHAEIGGNDGGQVQPRLSGADFRLQSAK